MQKILPILIASTITAASFTASAQGVVERAKTPPVIGQLHKAQTKTKAHLKASTTPIELPYFESFDTDVSSDFTILDSNFDDKRWQCLYGEMRIQFGSKAMDDWFITRPIPMSAEVEYTVSIKARAHNDYYAERFEVKAGDQPKAASMTVSVIPRTDVTSSSYVEYTGTFTPAADGSYYIGVHGCSDAGAMYLRADDLKITAPESAPAPAAPALSAIPSPDRDKKATVTVTAPAADSDGNPLVSLSKLVVLDAGDEVKTFDAPVPGQELQFTYEVGDDIGQGYRTLSAVAYNGSTMGEAAQASVYMGLNLPGIASDAVAYENNDDALVTVRWTRAQTDIDGFPQNSSLIRYNVYNNKGDLLDEEITDNWAQAQFLSKTQRYMYFLVMSINDTGINDTDYAETEMIAIGTPYQMPFAESFARAKLTTAWGKEGFGTLSLTDKAQTLPDVHPVDDDGGMVSWMPDSKGSGAMFMGGKIVIADSDNAALSFQYYDSPQASGQFTVMVNITTGHPLDSFVPVKEFTLGQCDDAGWRRVTVPLSQYKGEVLIPAFALSGNDGAEVILDDVRVIDLFDCNITLRTASAAPKVYLGNSVDVKINIENYGAKTVSDYTLNLIRDGKPVASKAGQPLAPASRMSVILSDTPLTTDEGVLKYHVEIACDDDADLSDNASHELSVNFAVKPYPVPEAPAATTEGQVTHLSWTPIDLSTARSRRFTEDFEDYQPFSYTDIGDWTMIDVDQADNWGVGGIGEFPNEKLPMAFMVFDITGIHSTYTAVSGTRHLASFSCRGGAQSDDWAVSPLLDGHAQRISFHVSSASASYGSETFDVMVSATGTDTSDFQSVYRCTDVPVNSWEMHEVDLPEGTRHFAIRCTEGKLMFKVDDVTYFPAVPELTLSGYNIYRDGAMLNSTPVADSTFDDTTADPGTHTYRISAVYDKGESSASDPTLVETVSTDIVAAGSITVTGADNIITVSSSAKINVNVYNLQGIRIAAATCDGRLDIPCPAGIYIVTTPAGTHKILVK